MISEHRPNGLNNTFSCATRNCRSRIGILLCSSYNIRRSGISSSTHFNHFKLKVRIKLVSEHLYTKPTISMRHLVCKLNSTGKVVSILIVLMIKDLFMESCNLLINSTRSIVKLGFKGSSASKKQC